MLGTSAGDGAPVRPVRRRGRTLRGDAGVQFDVKVALVGLIETRTLQQVRQIGRPDSIGGDNATMRKRQESEKAPRNIACRIIAIHLTQTGAISCLPSR
jgi:hypothetical protein